MRRRELLAAGLHAATMGLSGGLAGAWPLRLSADVRAMIRNEVDYRRPARLPTVIHLYLYGGASELAANLTNMAEVRGASQNPYPARLDPNRSTNELTTNALWSSAGGNLMERMLAERELSIYRTVHRRKEDNRAHARSIAQNLSGNVDPGRPGFGATLAAVLDEFDAFDPPVAAEDLPFVSFEGESLVFARRGVDLRRAVTPISLDPDFSNAFARANNGAVSREAGSDPALMRGPNNTALEGLAERMSSGSRLRRCIADAFAARRELARLVAARLNDRAVADALPLDPATGRPLVYPDSAFGRRLRAALVLATVNPATRFISLGGGLGWDDHSDALAEYPQRMRGLMEALSTAMRHLRLLGRDDVIINVFGDFGRNVNLNVAGGWDHGNNQVFYTLGGAGIPGRALGKLVGRTRHTVEAENRQYLAPASGSYECEPFSIASSVLRYFGVRNPQVLTGEPPVDEVNPPDERV